VAGNVRFFALLRMTVMHFLDCDTVSDGMIKMGVICRIHGVLHPHSSSPPSKGERIESGERKDS
jgi:hypothetical protein